MRSANFQEMGSLPRHRFRRRQFLHLHRHRSLCHLLSHPPRLSFPHHRRIPRRQFLHLHRHRPLCHLLSHPPRLPFPHHFPIPRRRFLRLHPPFLPPQTHPPRPPLRHRPPRRIPLIYRHLPRNLLLRVIRLIPISFRQVRRRPRLSPIHPRPFLRRQVPHQGQTQAGLRPPLHHLRRGNSPRRESFARVCWGLQRNP